MSDIMKTKYKLTYEDGTKIVAYYKRGNFYDQQGFELNTEDVVWCENL